MSVSLYVVPPLCIYLCISFVLSFWSYVSRYFYIPCVRQLFRSFGILCLRSFVRSAFLYFFRYLVHHGFMYVCRPSFVSLVLSFSRFLVFGYFTIASLVAYVCFSFLPQFCISLLLYFFIPLWFDFVMYVFFYSFSSHCGLFPQFFLCLNVFRYQFIYLVSLLVPVFSCFFRVCQFFSQLVRAVFSQFCISLVFIICFISSVMSLLLLFVFYVCIY